MFEASLLTELHHPAAAVEVVRGLRGGPLGQSTTVDLLEASALYGHRAYEQAQVSWDEA